MKTRINVIDPDVRRRAAVARQLITRGVHVEIYEDIAEFADSGGMSGLVFMSDDLSEATAVEIIEGIREASEIALPIVAYAENPSAENVVDAMRAGATDYLHWPFAGRLLDRVFWRLANGEDRFLQQETLRCQARTKVQELSRRETDVLVHLVQGLQNKGIARALGISPRTVEIHRANMMNRLGAQSTPDAIRIGLYAGLHEAVEPLALVVAA